VVTCSQEVSNQLEVFRKELAVIKQDLGQRKDNPNPVPQEVWSDIVNKIIPQEVSNKMSDVTAGMAELQQKTKAIQEERQEQDEIAKRKNCAIIHGLIEPTSVDPEDVKKEEEDRIVNLLHELKCDDVTVTASFRLGRKQDGPGAKPRPIKLIVASEQQKTKMLSNAKNLRTSKDTSLQKTFVQQDLTPRQREQRQVLVKELKERQSRGELNLIIVGGKIVIRRERT